MGSKARLVLCVAFLTLSACATQPVVLQATPQAVTSQTQPAATTPSQCPSPDTTVDFAPQFFAPGLGQSPTWAVFSNNGRVALGKFDQSQQMEHGFPVKVLWTIERAQTQPVTISGKNRETGEPLWFMINGQQAATSATLDPQQPAIPFQREGFAEFPSYLLLAKPGCYVLEAETAPKGASWQKNFLVTK